MNNVIIFIDLFCQFILLVLLSALIIVGLLQEAFRENFWILVALCLMFGSVLTIGDFDTIPSIFFNASWIIILMKLLLSNARKPTPEDFSDSGDVLNQETFDDKFDDKLNRYFIRHLWKLVGYLGYLIGLMGVIFWYQASQEHELMRRTITEKTGETELLQTYVQLIEKATSELKSQAEEDKKEKQVKIYEELIENFNKFNEQKLKLKIGEK